MCLPSYSSDQHVLSEVWPQTIDSMRQDQDQHGPGVISTQKESLDLRKAGCPSFTHHLPPAGGKSNWNRNRLSITVVWGCGLWASEGAGGCDETLWLTGVHHLFYGILGIEPRASCVLVSPLPRTLHFQPSFLKHFKLRVSYHLMDGWVSYVDVPTSV